MADYWSADEVQQEGFDAKRGKAKSGMGGGWGLGGVEMAGLSAGFYMRATMAFNRLINFLTKYIILKIFAQ